MRHNTEHGIAGKHCHNCKYLEWGEGDTGDPSGWMCNKRDYSSIMEESKHLSQLERKSYRFMGKRCFEQK